MKITEVKTFLIDAFRTNWAFIKVETDEGLYGWGEASLGTQEQALSGCVADIRRLVVGRDPRDIEKMCFEVYRDIYWKGGPVLMSAVSGIEMACWDILGKSMRICSANILLNELKAVRFIAILRRVPQKKILRAAEALSRAGIRFIEITFDPSDPETLRDTAEKMNLVHQAFPEMHLGCGMVLTEAMAETAAKAGAEYCLAPNTRKSVIDCCHRHQIPVFPGAYTPCEIADAWEMGADAVKIFPIQPAEEVAECVVNTIRCGAMTGEVVNLNSGVYFPA